MRLSYARSEVRAVPYTWFEIFLCCAVDAVKRIRIGEAPARAQAVASNMRKFAAAGAALCA